MTQIAVHLIDENGQPLTLELQTGRSLMKAAVAAGVEGIAADCGGCLTCATCHVILDEAWAGRFPPPDADELSMLEMTASPRQPTSRLSCQLALDASMDGLRLRLPETQY
jgi:2Fe-2S ferredoxin